MKSTYNKNILGALLTLALLPVLLFVTGCGAGRDKANVELIQDMMDQNKLKSQSYDEYFQRPAVRTPPENTVPRGYEPYKYEGDPFAAETNLKNPLASTPDVLRRGQTVYNIYCSVCHGAQGGGDGPVSQYIQAIPGLTTDRAAGFKDGRLYHIIIEGQGRMRGYQTQIPDANDRWAVVQYIRSMQKGR